MSLLRFRRSIANDKEPRTERGVREAEESPRFPKDGDRATGRALRVSTGAWTLENGPRDPAPAAKPMTENSVGRQFWGRSWVQEDAKEAIRPSNVREALSQYYRERSPPTGAATSSFSSKAPPARESLRPYSPFNEIGNQFSSLARSISETRDNFRSAFRPSSDSGAAAPSAGQLLLSSQSANVLGLEPLDARSDQRDSRSSASALSRDARLQDVLRDAASARDAERGSHAGPPPRHLDFLQRDSGVEAVPRHQDSSPLRVTGSLARHQDFPELHAPPQFREPGGPQNSLRTHTQDVSTTPKESINSSVRYTPWLTTDLPRSHDPALPSTQMSDAPRAKPSLGRGDDFYPPSKVPSEQPRRFSDRYQADDYLPSRTDPRRFSDPYHADTRLSRSPSRGARRFSGNYPRDNPIVYPTRRRSASSNSSSSSEHALRHSRMSQVQQKIRRYMDGRGGTSSSSSSSSTSSETSRELSTKGRQRSAATAAVPRRNRARKRSPSVEAIDRPSRAKEQEKAGDMSDDKRKTGRAERAEKKHDDTPGSSRSSNKVIKGVSAAETVVSNAAETVVVSNAAEKTESAPPDAPRRLSYVEMKKNMQIQRGNDTKLSDIEARLAILEAENKKHAERLQLTDDRLAAADTNQQAWKQELEERIDTRCTKVEEGFASRLTQVEEAWQAKVKELEAKLQVEGMTERRVRSIIQHEIVEAKYLLQQKWKQHQLEAMQQPAHWSPTKSYGDPKDHLIDEPEMEQGTDADSMEEPSPAPAPVWTNPTSSELADSVLRVKSIAKAARRVTADLGHLESVEKWDEEWVAERHRLKGLRVWAKDILGKPVETGTSTSSDDDAPHVRVNIRRSSSSRDSNYDAPDAAPGINRASSSAQYSADDAPRAPRSNNRETSSSQYSTYDVSHISHSNSRVSSSTQFSTYDAPRGARGKNRQLSSSQYPTYDTPHAAKGNRARSSSQTFGAASYVLSLPERHPAEAKKLISRRSPPRKKPTETGKRGSSRRKLKTESQDIVF
eukprot:GEMP01006239.1.p1 GENE.GEMP01006239.1~~GEMP01006239.1.p1  ORF type:complete len:1014 (+),score=261.20 GEMP01006239.1:78-3119(+)